MSSMEIAGQRYGAVSCERWMVRNACGAPQRPPRCGHHSHAGALGAAFQAVSVSSSICSRFRESNPIITSAGYAMQLRKMGDESDKYHQSPNEPVTSRATGLAQAKNQHGEALPSEKQTHEVRRLISIPIIHSEQDMGSLRSNLKREYVQRYDAEKWDKHVKIVDELWTAISQDIESLNLPYGNVRIYQDGLPECGREIEIVREVAAQGSKNYQLVLELVNRGAKLMGTENPELLIKEYQLHKEALAAKPREGKEGKVASKQWQEQSRRLLAERDRYIAARINGTLLPGEIGILFIGLAHSVEPLVNLDILVKKLLSIPQNVGKQHG